MAIMLMWTVIKKALLVLLVLACIILIHDLLSWRPTLSRIEKISTTVGQPVSEALRYLEDNRELLCIESIGMFEAESKEWMVVRLRNVSIIGVMLSWCCGDWVSGAQISGLVQLTIENGKVSQGRIFN